MLVSKAFSHSKNPALQLDQKMSLSVYIAEHENISDNRLILYFPNLFLDLFNPL